MPRAGGSAFPNESMRSEMVGCELHTSPGGAPCKIETLPMTDSIALHKVERGTCHRAQLRCRHTMQDPSGRENAVRRPPELIGTWHLFAWVTKELVD